MLEREFKPGFEHLKKNVKELLDFNTFQYKDTYLGRRFDSRLRFYHIDTYEEYWQILRKDIQEQETLRKELTINVTEFFRDNSVWRIIKEDIVPNIIKNKQGKIRVWSAGSSDGKEAYSIAMIFLKHFMDIMLDLKLK